MKFGIVVFPGSNCDHDAYHAAKHVLGQEAEFVWHRETDLGAPTSSCSLEGSRTATISGRGRSRGSRR